MARRLSRHVSTIHRELRRNRTDAGAWLRGYFAVGAQQVSDLRRRRRTKLHAPGSIALRSYIVEQLGNGWSPEQIAGYLFPVSTFETVWGFRLEEGFGLIAVT
jgi:IS30 family transposase